MEAGMTAMPGTSDFLDAVRAQGRRDHRADRGEPGGVAVVGEAPVAELLR